MVVDRNTKPTYLNICLEDNKEFEKMLQEGRKLAEDELNDEDNKFIIIRPQELSVDEYFYDSETNELKISCIFGKNNDSIYIDIPLSDSVLIDIMGNSIKKLNKLKTVLESLK